MFNVEPPPPLNTFIAGRPKAALLFGSLVVLDMVCGYLNSVYVTVQFVEVKISDSSDRLKK